jgi:hypothetical protein
MFTILSIGIVFPEGNTLREKDFSLNYERETMSILTNGRISLDNKFLRGVGFGMVGGLIGTILMDIVMMLTFVIVGQSPTTFFTMVGEKLGYGALAGIVIHNLVGITGGFVFSVMVQVVRPLHIESMRKGILLGIGVGAITIPLGCIPLAIWLDQPILIVIGFSFLPHLVWGAVLGWIVGYGLLHYGRPVNSTVQVVPPRQGP